MPTLIENADPKRNPYTSVFGVCFLLVSLAMTCVKYLAPVFVELKQDIPYEGWHILIVVLVGLFLIFMNDSYFGRIFNRVDKITARRTETPDKIVDEIQITKTKPEEK